MIFLFYSQVSAETKSSVNFNFLESFVKSRLDGLEN